MACARGFTCLMGSPSIAWAVMNFHRCRHTRSTNVTWRYLMALHMHCLVEFADGRQVGEARGRQQVGEEKRPMNIRIKVF